MAITSSDIEFLRRAVDLAQKALENGDEPFGSVLVSHRGEVLFEDHNHISGGDHTQHPEFNIARWAAQNMTPQDRAKATVYTSGEHCPMCSGAHGMVGLGRIVMASSTQQLTEWRKGFGAPPSRVKPLPVQDIIRDIVIDGPVEMFREEIYQMHLKSYQRQTAQSF